MPLHGQQGRVGQTRDGTLAQIFTRTTLPLGGRDQSSDYSGLLVVVVVGPGVKSMMRSPSFVTVASKLRRPSPSAG